MADNIVTSIHGRLIGLGRDGELIILSGIITSTDGSRISFPDGIDLPGIAQTSKSSDYTLVLADAQTHIYHPSSDTTPRTWTIPANASVAFGIGDCVTFVNDTAAGALTIAITSDTLWLAGTTTTGSRTIAAGGVATAMKVAATRWVISGSGLT